MTLFSAELTTAITQASAATAALAAGKGPGVFPTAEQTVAASATIATYVAPAGGTAVGAFNGTPMTGDRTITVQVLIGATSVFTGATPILLNAAAAGNVVNGTINVAANTFAKGSVITVVTVYTAGTGGGGGLLKASVGYQLT